MGNPWNCTSTATRSILAETADTVLAVGVAPGARIVSVKVAGHDGATDVSQVIAAIDWVIQHRNDNGMNIRIIALAYGTDGSQHYTDDPLSHIVEQAWNAGIVVVAAALVALAAVPVGLTRIPQPGAIPPATFSPWLVFRTSRAAVVSSFASGIVTGSFWGVGSLYGRQIGLDVGGISLIMAMGVMGGALKCDGRGTVSCDAPEAGALTGGFTIEAWVRATRPPAEPTARRSSLPGRRPGRSRD